MTDRVSDWNRTPGQGTYARIERERRFLLSAVPPGLSDERLIEDRYLDGLRLRLRRVSGAGQFVFKLTQKIRAVDSVPSTVALTNIYLSESEYDRLVSLPGRNLRKTRRHWRDGEHLLAVDEFHGHLEGLFLAELEVQDLSESWPIRPPVLVEVTTDDRFSGGYLAGADLSQVEALLVLAATQSSPHDEHD